MRTPIIGLALLASLALSCGAISGSVGGRRPPPVPMAQPAAGPALSPEEALKGIDLSGLTPEQRQAVSSWAQETFCACGCPHTVSACLRGHGTCNHAPRMVKLAAGLAAKGATGPEIGRIVQAYYTGFDRRARLDLAGLGTPLGSPEAKVTLVVVSDFTCPFCKIFVPSVEQFVKDHADKVRLFAKPFPIATHPGAQEAAEAGEWARDAGKYWELSALLYAQEDAPTPDGLAALAERVGGDPAALREALESGKYKARIDRSQAEARTAGLSGTPTVFVNGRKLEDLSQEGLTFALEDELEWVAHGSWAKD